jgi:alcohol dehydrogenase, propanol-preferring
MIVQKKYPLTDGAGSFSVSLVAHPTRRTMMRAALLHTVGEPLRVTDVPTPRPGDGEVLVRTAASGVCFTDLKIADGMVATLPVIPGHEPVGIVAEVGAGVNSVRPGARVAVHARFYCRRCAACLSGNESLCEQGIFGFAGVGHDGGFAEYTLAPADHVVALPEQLDFADAAPLLCAGLTTFTGLRSAGLRPGQRVAVLGIGGLGHLAVSIAAALGAEVYAVTSSSDKIADALARGAVFAGSAADTGARLTQDGGAHIVLNTVDDLGPLSAIVPALAVGATVVLAAGSEQPLPIDAVHFLTHQLTVQGTFFGSPTDLQDLLALAAERGIRPQIERYSLDDINEVADRLRSNTIRYRAVVEFDPPQAD